ncbi:MAG: NAD(P)H-hydrate dehydratase [Planctomycetota bacterium]|nr:NAD(P)H-hydrate dehydratase [Planctomycetota bacterium]
MPAGKKRGGRARRLRIVRSLPALPRRAEDAHKVDFGRVLLIAGSPGMTGAATFAAEATLRSGAGLVLVGCPKTLNPILEVKLTACMTLPLPETRQGTLRRRAARDILALSEKWTTLAIGPGLSTHPETRDLVLNVLPKWKGEIVVDADALNHCATDLEVLRRCHDRVVLTPHPGEFSRLTGLSTKDIQKDRAGTASRFAREHRVVLVLKGSGTVVSDGERIFTNRSGNPGMATAGSGDVLTGMIAAMLGQGLEPFAAASLAVALHGKAGDLAAKEVGQVSMTAEDLLDSIPAAIRNHGRGRSKRST